MADAQITEMTDPKSGAKYQLIQPANQPHTKVKFTGKGDVDFRVVDAADRGVQRHAGEFDGWIDEWVNALEGALGRLKGAPQDRLASELLTAAAHEVKGGGTMANAPALTALANPLCDLMERVDDAAAHIDLIELCVLAIDAARREKRFEPDDKVRDLVAALDAETIRRTSSGEKQQG